MIRAFSFPVSPERSRLRGWLEGTLAGLCELHLLRERQERRVRQALRIAAEEESPSKPGEGEPAGGGGEPAPEDQLDALPGLMWELEQQLGLLRMHPEKSCGETAETESWPSSGFYEGQLSAVASDSPASGFGDSSSSFPSASGSYSRIGRVESRLGYASERPKSVGDVANSGKEGASRSTVPRSFSAPYSSSPDYPAEAALPACYPPDPFLYPSPLHAVALQNPLLLRSHLYEDPAFSSAASQGLAYPPGQEGGLEAYGSEFQYYSEAASHCHKVESYISRLIRRRSQLVRGSKPRTSLGGSEPAAKSSLARQSSLCKRPGELLPPPAERKPPPAMERGSSTPSPCGHEAGGAPAATRIWSSWDAAAERTLAAQGAAEDFSPPHSSLKKPPKLQALAHLRPTSVDQYEAGYPSSPLLDGEDGASRGNGQDPTSYEAEDAACLMVQAQYIPAQQPPRAQQSHRAGKKKPPPLTKGRSVELSPERLPLIPRERPRVLAPPKKCRFTEEGGEGAGRKGAGRKSSPRSRKAARSQSENSLLNKPGVKCGTTEREETALKPARPRRPHGGAAGGYRKWRSTAEICQEEPSTGGAVEPRRSRRGAGPAGYGYAGSDSECSAEPARQAPMCRLEEGLVYGDSESSLSDGESPPPYSSGASSDTDESGGLVWPQQLSPQLVSASGPGKATSGQPKVFVKIKASHALKKKIMRFRSGSLKVMTTV
ncbi:dapper homolog 3 [Hemicordylus capensis]|uniref:dapper homolog 3 n=1 Tax=Hemicordylus capensis TaxID=884348 RepID=UPI002303508F|nr:dapper homolog 3 [Hemicordylus capensis]